MVRLSKQARRRSVSYKRTKAPTKCGTKQEVIFKTHQNALGNEVAAYIPKMGVKK